MRATAKFSAGVLKRDGLRTDWYPKCDVPRELWAGEVIVTVVSHCEMNPR